jgi:hypothetical protein
MFGVSTPTEFTELTEVWMAAWAWQGCHTLIYLCTSVTSVGEYLSSPFREICVFCGRTSPAVLLAAELQHFAVFEVALQLVVNVHLTHACGCTSE